MKALIVTVALLVYFGGYIPAVYWMMKEDIFYTPNGPEPIVYLVYGLAWPILIPVMIGFHGLKILGWYLWHKANEDK